MLVVGMVLVTFTPLVFVVGFVVGKHHTKRLAINGGEEKYPDVIADKVRTYRDENKHYVESLRFIKNNDN